MPHFSYATALYCIFYDVRFEDLVLDLRNSNPFDSPPVYVELKLTEHRKTRTPNLPLRRNISITYLVHLSSPLLSQHHLCPTPILTHYRTYLRASSALTRALYKYSASHPEHISMPGMTGCPHHSPHTEVKVLVRSSSYQTRCLGYRLHDWCRLCWFRSWGRRVTLRVGRIETAQQVLLEVVLCVEVVATEGTGVCWLSGYLLLR